MRKLTLLAISVLLIASLAGCGKDKKKDLELTMDPVQTEAVVTEAPTETPAPTEDPHAGMALSKLTGEYVKEKIAKQRPYAVMINNIEYAAKHHSGLSEASIMYEAKVEGGITRLMALFEDFKSGKIGSVRSARHYYVSVAAEYDAIFVHFGHTKFATAKIEELGVDNLSGLSGIGSTVFYRDNNISAPHNAFASKKGLLAGRKKLKYDKNYDKDFEGHFKFYETDTDLVSDKIANKVTVQFSGYAKPYFIYDEATKLYKRYQYGREHIDCENNEQLAFKNIIIQCVDEEQLVKGHRLDYRHIKFENAEGKGKYITNGKAVNITWKKNDKEKFMKYYAEDGTELVINPGKTYIALFPNEGSDLTISKKVK